MKFGDSNTSMDMNGEGGDVEGKKKKTALS